MLALTFPGQGSQKPGMGAPWQDTSSWRLVAEASDITGQDCAALLLTADALELTQTHKAQLATFVLSLVVLEEFRSNYPDVKPSVVAGHSLGEFSALVAAGILSFADGCRLVAERGDAMMHAATLRPGSMSAIIGGTDDVIAAACAQVPEVWVANYNAPGQTVISGDPKAVEQAGETAVANGAKRVVILPVGGAFHTPFMKPASVKLHTFAQSLTYHQPQSAVVTNCDGARKPAHSTHDWAENARQQLTSSVQWRNTTATLLESEVHALLELGPGAVLTGLAKRNAPDTPAMSISAPDHLDLAKSLVESATQATQDRL